MSDIDWGGKPVPVTRLCGWDWVPLDIAQARIAALEAALTAERERADRAAAEAEAVRALLRWPGDFCLSCGGDGGHEEACRGTTGLLALQAQRDELRERVARLVGAMEQIAQLDYTRGAVNMAATKANAIARAALGEGK